MSLPKIDVSALPDLPAQTGVYGSMSDNKPQYVEDVTLFVLMVFLLHVLGPD